MTPTTPALPSGDAAGAAAADERWNKAVDWLLNSRYTADPDIQGPFWAYVDGKITRDELSTFTIHDVLRREEDLRSGAIQRPACSDDLD
jgi:hypothetical protein